MIVVSSTDLARETKAVLDLVSHGENVIVERYGILFEIRLANLKRTGVETLKEAKKRLQEGVENVANMGNSLSD